MWLMSRALCVRKTLWERQLSPSSAAGPQLYSQEYKHVPRPSKQPLIEEAAIQGTEAARRDLFVGLPFSQPVATSLLRGHSHPRGPGKHLQGCWGLTKGGMWERWRWLQRVKGRRAKGLWRDTQVLGCSECQTLLGFLFCFFLHTTKLLPPSWQLQSSVPDTAEHGLCLSTDWWLCLASAHAKSTSSAFAAMGGCNWKGSPPAAAGHCFHRDLLPETSHALPSSPEFSASGLVLN